ncbi:MAG: spermidine/putrescine ABC transporter substrate-binding protein [Chromatiaceae bacterium]|nr:spermidine/putrescine ABC transporter substrate-binding protein [Chromatiaceae bacterium]MCF7994561.1 spermidine/putrescine ABC transporter substrate-binding protein [Chromatiaceae bacterium]MCF8004457.1 spermidine/putrescine ABC transporter substrate-binding protein [Chromatiaceae bacterium]
MTRFCCSKSGGRAMPNVAGLVLTLTLALLWPSTHLLAEAEQSNLDQAAATPPRELVFYNWTAYIDQEVVKAFEQQYNARVVQRYFQSADERDETLMRNEGKGFDVLVVTAGDLPPYIERGWLQPLDKAAMPNLKHVDRRWIDGFDGADDYAAPYLWGTTGLVWRSDLIEQPLTRWSQYYAPQQAWTGRVMVLNQYRVAFGMALKSLGYSFNSTSLDEVEEAAALLRAQKPFVQNYGYFKTDADSGIVSGETWIGQTWNGDALLLMERNSAIRYLVPEEGGELMIDYLVIPAKAREPELANAFINWLHQPAHAAACAESLQFATPNLAANALLPEAFLNNPVIYPPAEVLERSEVQQPLPAEIQQRMISVWAQLIN